MTTTASGVYTDVCVLYKPNMFQSRSFLIKIYEILKNNIFTCSCWASIDIDIDIDIEDLFNVEYDKHQT